MRWPICISCRRARSGSAISGGPRAISNASSRAGRGAGMPRRAAKQAERSAAAMAPVLDWLGAHLPQSGAAALLHNDYRLDNCLLDSADPGRIEAVLDWDMCTQGDPLADLGYVLNYWVEPGDPTEWREIAAMPTWRDGFPSRAEAIAALCRAHRLRCRRGRLAPGLRRVQARGHHPADLYPLRARPDAGPALPALLPPRARAGRQGRTADPLAPRGGAAMKIARTVADLRRQVAAWRGRGERVGLVPTMGAIHAGHLALVHAARDAERTGRRLAVREPEAVRAVRGFFLLSARRDGRFRRFRRGRGRSRVHAARWTRCTRPASRRMCGSAGSARASTARSAPGISRGSRRSSASCCCNACRTPPISARRIISNCWSCGGWRATSTFRCASRACRPCAKRTVSRCRRATSICRPRSAARRRC